MKDAINAYYHPSESEFTELWQKAIIVVDANVLLNLYRYPEQASNDLLNALGQLSTRLWMPYYAALEYQRNRLGVVADQKRRFREVEGIIDDSTASMRQQLDKLQLKRRHSTIEVDDFLDQIDSATLKFRERLKALDEKQCDVQNDDNLRDRIDSLFAGRIGELPKEQKELDALWKEGDERYKRRMPPGYMDQKKADDKDPDDFQFDGLVFRRSFGDLLVWKQTIAYAKEQGIKHVIFVTDDEKEDWWWTVDSGGKRKIGPRPELVNEICREAGTEVFFMYNSDQFLRRASEFLKVQVPEESISQVRDVRVAARNRHQDFIRQRQVSEYAAFSWLQRQFPSGSIIRNERGFPDFLVSFGGPNSALGFEVLSIRSMPSALMRLRESVYRAYYEVSEGGVSQVTFIVIAEDAELAERVHSFAKSDRFPEMRSISFIIGVVDEEGEEPVFQPIYGAND